MPVPGISSLLLAATGLSRAYGADALNVDPWLELGSPESAVRASIFVGSGVTIGSASVNDPAMLIRFWDGSVIDLIVAGRIGAAGGDGGDGDRHGGSGVGSFRGGGGGGGAGTNPGAKGLRYPETDPDAGNLDGSAGTTTTGGSGGVSDFGDDITPFGGYIAGDQTDRIAINPGLLIWPADGHSITVNIWCSGSITAGGNGGVGGYKDGDLPGGANDAEDGEDLPDYYTAAQGTLTDHPAIWYRFLAVTLNIREGGAYPNIKGRVVFSGSQPS